MKTILTYLWFIVCVVAASSAYANTCSDDPNECTYKNLCEMATIVSGGQKVWSYRPQSGGHVRYAQDLGMNCGVVAVVDLCETDPNKCTIGQLCEKATKTNGGRKVWNSSAQAYVEIAKKYELNCSVVEQKKPKLVHPKTLTATELATANRQCDDWYHGRNDDRSFWARSPIYIIGHCVKRFGVNYRDYVGHTPLHIAVTHRNPRIENIEYLLALGTDVNLPRKYLGTVQTPLITAIMTRTVQKKKSEIIMLLIQYGADVSKANSNGLTPLKAYKGTDQNVIAVLSGNKTPKAKHFVESLHKQNTIKAEHFSKSDFQKLSSLKRKQLQYALKEIGFYKSVVDGIYGPKTQAAVRAFAMARSINSGYPDSVLRELASEVSLPSSFPSTKRTTNYSNSGSNTSSGTTSGSTFLKGIAAITVCSLAPNPSACLSGVAGNQPNSSSSSGQINNNPVNDNSCTRDGNCDYNQMCIKQPGMTRGLCFTKPSRVGRDWSPARCNKHTDCPVGGRCDRTYKICVER